MVVELKECNDWKTAWNVLYYYYGITNLKLSTLFEIPRININVLINSGILSKTISLHDLGEWYIWFLFVRLGIKKFLPKSISAYSKNLFSRFKVLGAHFNTYISFIHFPYRIQIYNYMCSIPTRKFIINFGLFNFFKNNYIRREIRTIP